MANTVAFDILPAGFGYAETVFIMSVTGAALPIFFAKHHIFGFSYFLGIAGCRIAGFRAMF